MLFFQPGSPRQVYNKQLLDVDELPYFEKGDRQLLLQIKNVKIAPAICYESLQPEHAREANAMGADVYLASVAKTDSGIRKAFAIYPEIAAKYTMPVLMANCVGICDNLVCRGRSAVWNKNGDLLDHLEGDSEGILLYDTQTGDIQKHRC